jgi:tRNA (adenine57-N1/adenine58-N1)-methyltransferase
MEGRKPGGPLREGEEVILVDPKGEEHMITLSPGKPFGTHKGNILHEDIIGKPDGSRVWTAMGTQYQVFRPTFNQYVMNLKRHAQIIYPKDIGPILLWADIFPGATVTRCGRTSPQAEPGRSSVFSAHAPTTRSRCVTSTGG